MLGIQGRGDVGSHAFHCGLKLVSKNEIKMHKDAEMREVMAIMVVLEVRLQSLFFWLLYNTPCTNFPELQVSFCHLQPIDLTTTVSWKHTL